MIAYMESVSLQFHGVRSGNLLVMLSAALAAVLAGVGAWQLLRRRWRYGAVCLGAALGPAVVVMLAVDTARRYARNDRRGAMFSGAWAGISAGVIAVGAILAAASGESPQARWMAVLGVQVALAVGVFYSAVFRSLRPARLATLMLLRCVAIVVLLLTLFKPAVSVSSTPDADESKPPLPILVDRSGSMTVSDGPDTPTRYAQVLRMLAGQQQRLEEHFTPVVYHFARKPRAVESISGLGAAAPAEHDADKTDIAAAINIAASGSQRRRTAGILLISDGNHNTAAPVADAAAQAAVPVYAIGVGAIDKVVTGRRNIQISSIEAPMSVIENNVTTITARVKIAGFASIPTEIRLTEQGAQQPLATKAVWTDKDFDTAKLQLKWTPRGRASGDVGNGQAPRQDIRKLQLSIPRNPAETVKEDNLAELHVLVTRPRIRVLYIEGTMRTEYKFLRRLLDSDPNVQFASLVRISGNRFWSQGGIDGMKFATLPGSDEQFGVLDVIIIGDLDADFLTAARKIRIRKFVNDGGGLLMLGGHNSFGPGGYDGTPVEEALPVIVGERDQPQEKTPFVPRLTAAGAAHPVFEGIKSFFPSPSGRPEANLPKLPDLNGCVAVVDKKQGASVLAVHPGAKNRNGPLIALAVQRFGSGRSAAFMPDTTWKWHLPMRPLGDASPYRIFWSQMIRWLAGTDAESPRASSAAVLRLDRTYVRVGETVKILAAVLNRQGRRAKSAGVSCSITPVMDESNAKAQQLPLAQKGDGLFAEEFKPSHPGRYEIALTASDPSGEEFGRDEITLTVAPHHAELEKLARNTKLLDDVAKESGARHMDLAELPDLVDQLIKTASRLTGREPGTVRNYPLYNFTLLFIVFAAALTTEWLLRRNWQLR